MSIYLPILHYNDVYRIGQQKVGNSYIDVTQFAATHSRLQSKWQLRDDGKTRDGLCLFSGDLYSPSRESISMRGDQMVPVMNFLAPDVALTGNHDFDFGYLRLTQLTQQQKFPWILSNIIDKTTGKIPAKLREFEILERTGLRIGIIGLVEEDWIATIGAWPEDFEYVDMVKVGIDLSSRLRDPNGEYRCDFIIALTHCRLPSDLKLARDLNVLSPAAQDRTPTKDLHGADIILGGHDHFYYISKGVTEWTGYDVNTKINGAVVNDADVVIVKSGTDFQDLSEVSLELNPTDGIRKFVLSKITGIRHTTQPDDPRSPELQPIVKDIVERVDKKMKVPLCYNDVELDYRPEVVRTGEAASSNWIVDIIRPSYDGASLKLTSHASDGAILPAGSMRSATIYKPGLMTLGDILDILPYSDPAVLIEVDGATLWDALNSALSKWPAHEGRFPVISGLRVEWDSRKEAYNRVSNIWRLQSNEQGLVEEISIPNNKEGRKYKIVTGQYLFDGNDGYDAFKRAKLLIGAGRYINEIVHDYLLASRYLLNAIHSPENTQFLDARTSEAISRTRTELRFATEFVASQNVEKSGFEQVPSPSLSHYRDRFRISHTEDLRPVCELSGQEMIAQENLRPGDIPTNLPHIHPIRDGRMKNQAQAEGDFQPNTGALSRCIIS